MKRSFFLISFLVVLLLISIKSNSQSQVTKSKWQFNEISFGLGIDNDHYSSVSLDHMMTLAKDPDQMQRDLSGMTEEASTVNYGGAFYFHYGFNPLNKSDNTYRTDRMLQMGIGYHGPKEAMLSYKNEGLDTSIVYCNIQNELTVEASYLFLGRWGKRSKWRWYVGFGASYGFTFNDQMVLIAGRYFGPEEHPSSQENFEKNVSMYAANSVSYARIYVPYGIHYALGSKWLIGLDFRTGIGMQMIKGGNSNYIKKTGATALSFKYSFL